MGSLDLGEYERLGPLSFKDEAPVAMDRHATLEATLCGRFGGFTRQAGFEGQWDDGSPTAAIHRDALVSYRVATAGIADVITVAIATGLAFGQLAMYLVLSGSCPVIIPMKPYAWASFSRQRRRYAVPPEAIVNLLRLQTISFDSGQHLLAFEAFDEERLWIPLVISTTELPPSLRITQGGMAVVASTGTNVDIFVAKLSLQTLGDSLLEVRLGSFLIDSVSAEQEPHRPDGLTLSQIDRDVDSREHDGCA
jgi:hypothetical protein